MTNHRDWYSQRYVSANRIRQVAEKVEKYQALTEEKKAKQENLEESVEIIFREHNIFYTVKTNFLVCNINGYNYYYYPKSGKWRPKGGKKLYYSIGVADFLGKVWNYHNQQ